MGARQPARRNSRDPGRAAEWWLAQRRALGVVEERDTEGLLAFMRAHVHGLEQVREGLLPDFVLGEPVRGAYLHRWNLAPELRAVACA